jgi:hypothetical protein
MSNSFGQAAPAAPAPAPAATEPTTPAPATEAPPASAGAGTETNGVHPSWERALEHIPEAWRAPIVSEFQNADREAQKAIEKARAEAAPAEWQNLLEQARQNGLTPDELIDAYNGQIDLQNRIKEDPDAFLTEISDFIDQQVASGALTRKQATQARKEVADAAAAAGEDPLYETPEAKEIRELKEWRAQQEAQQAAAAKQQQEQASEQEAQAYADQFMQTFDSSLAAQGLGELPLPLQHQLALTADSILGANPAFNEQQAIDAAITNFRQSLGALGAQLPGPAAQQAAPALPPVIGGGTSTPPPAQQQTPQTQDGRSSEAVRVMREMLGQQ